MAQSIRGLSAALKPFSAWILARISSTSARNSATLGTSNRLAESGSTEMTGIFLILTAAQLRDHTLNDELARGHRCPQRFAVSGPYDLSGMPLEEPRPSCCSNFRICRLTI